MKINEEISTTNKITIGITMTTTTAMTTPAINEPKTTSTYSSSKIFTTSSIDINTTKMTATATTSESYYSEKATSTRTSADWLSTKIISTSSNAPITYYYTFISTPITSNKITSTTLKTTTSTSST